MIYKKIARTNCFSDFLYAYLLLKTLFLADKITKRTQFPFVVTSIFLNLVYIQI